MRGKAGLFSRFVPFSPTNIEGLTAWWDASDAATLFNSDSGGSQSSADGEVGRLEDKGGSGRHFTQGNSSHRPTRKTAQRNGLDVVRFDGVSDRMGTSQNFSEFCTADAGTVFVVASASAVNTNSGAQSSNDVILTESGGAHGFVMLRSNDTAAAFGFNVDTFAYATASASYEPSNWKVFSTSHDGVDLSFRINGGSPATDSLGTRGFIDATLLIGVNNALTQFFSGDVGEIIVYNVALSSGDREAVESYLMDKWAIT